VRLQLGDGFRFLLQNGRGYAEFALALKGAASGHHFVEHGAEGKDVAAGIDFVAVHLLG